MKKFVEDLKYQLETLKKMHREHNHIVSAQTRKETEEFILKLELMISNYEPHVKGQAS